MNCGLEIRESHDFETHLNFKSDFMGSLNRISKMISDGRVAIGPEEYLIFFECCWIGGSEGISSISLKIWERKGFLRRRKQTAQA